MGRQQLVEEAPPAERADAARLAALFDAQREHRWTMAKTTAAERVERLERLKREIVARASELYDAIHADFRKHAAEVELTELQPVLVEISHTIKHLATWMRPKRVGTPFTLFGTFSEVRYEAKGIALVLAPWNYPFNLLINPLVAAIAAGNCAIVKPSEKTPATSRFVKSLVEDVFDPREVACVEGGADVAKALLELPFDHIFFTGSTRVGKLVMAAAARHLASVTLELGGKSPAIVDESADLDLAARRIVWGKFINAGQTCVAPDYVLVPRSKADAFLERARLAVAAEYGETESARRESADFARIIDSQNAERLRALVDDAVTRGARLVTGGEADVAERYLAPTILGGVTEDAAVMHEEIFGPVLPVLAYGSLDEAIGIVRRRDKPLALYVFSERDETVDRILAETTAGGTAVNNVVVHLANPNLPFGGIGASGVGNYHGEFGFRSLSHERGVLRQGKLGFLQFLYPPYTERVRGMLARVTRWVQ
jgi:aldehyde dehydrogenase (NAD+)